MALVTVSVPRPTSHTKGCVAERTLPTLPKIVHIFVDILYIIWGSNDPTISTHLSNVLQFKTIAKYF